MPLVVSVMCVLLMELVEDASRHRSHRPGVSFHNGTLVSGVVLQKLVGQLDQI